MSVSIRLAKFGKRHAPSYRVVVTKTKTKRNGKFIEILGFFNPSDHTTEFTLDKEKYEDWVKKGAIVSDAVKKLVDGTYEYVKYDPAQAKVEEGEEKADGAEGTPADDAPADAKEEKETPEEKPAEDESKSEEETPAEEKPENSDE